MENALNPVPEDEVFISHENGETMVKKKFQKTLILKSPTSAPVASTSSTVLHKEKNQPPKEKGKYLEIRTFKKWFFSLYSKSSLAHVRNLVAACQPIVSIRRTLFYIIFHSYSLGMKAVVSGLVVAAAIGVTAITMPTIPTAILLAPLVIPIAILHQEYKKTPKLKSTKP